MHCSVESGSRAETCVGYNCFLCLSRKKSSDLPWYSAGGHGLLPQLQAREPAAHTGTVSEQCLEPNRARFSRQLKRISVQLHFPWFAIDHASQVVAFRREDAVRLIPEKFETLGTARPSAPFFH